MTILFGSGICLLMFGIKLRLISNSLSIFLPLFVPLSIMNAIEVSFYFNQTQSLLGLKLYYVSALCSIGGSIFISLKLTNSNMLIGFIYYLMAAFTAFMFIFDSNIIDGYRPFLLTITAERGEFYYIWQSTALLGFITIVYLLCNGIKYGKTRKIRAMCTGFLTSICAPLLLGIVVIISMAIGYKINATVWLPVSTTISMLLSYLLMTENRIIDIRYLFRKNIIKIVLRLMSCNLAGAYPLKSDLQDYERVLVLTSLTDTSGTDGSANVDACAKQLEISQSSVRRKKKQFDEKTREI